jgi:hypothetical protein
MPGGLCLRDGTREGENFGNLKGALETLPHRIHDEVSAMNGVISLIPLVGVWARKPSDSGVWISAEMQSPHP